MLQPNVASKKASRTADETAAVTPPDFEDGLHVRCRVARRVALPRHEFLAWSRRTPLEKVLPGTRLVAAVQRTEPVVGTYPDPGSIRRVILADGSSALEVIHEDSADRFRYQVWGFTAAPFIRYARCAFHYGDDGDGTVIDWSYEFRPKSALFTPLVFVFAKLVFRGFISRGLATICTLAERARQETESGQIGPIE